MKCTFKISIVGCGNVGATMAYALLLDGLPTDLTLIDINKDKAHGLCLDFEHSLSFTDRVKLDCGDDMGKCAGSNIVIVTAGRGQKEGETRLDLVEGNKKIFADIIPKIAKAAPNAILIIVSNPVDVLAHEALRLSGFPKERVFGSGTALDTARFQFHLSEKLHVSPKSVDAYIMGEHGDTSFPVISSASVMGKRLLDFEGFSEKDAKQCYEDTREAAYRIIHDVGYTCYSISTTVRQLARAIFDDTHEVFLLSSLLDDYYGHSDVCVSVPCVLGQNGIVKVLDVPLNEEEQMNLTKSVKTIKEFL
jgi:L-lactate dehydrogenase